MRFADLHLHTFHSDGTRSPREVIDLAKRARIEIVAISDHDNIAAYFDVKQYADEQGITLVPATELSCGYEGVDVHVLAYAFDPFDEQLERRLVTFRQVRAERGAAMVAKLQALGCRISIERVRELAGGGAMGRPHVARALVEAKHVSSVADAFEKYLGAGKPAYVDKARFDIDEAVELIHGSGGILPIAHPTLYKDHERIVPELLDRGVDAVEVFHPDVDEANQQRYRNLARFRGKHVTGGSDDHGTAKSVQTIGTVKVPESLIGAILERV